MRNVALVASLFALAASACHAAPSPLPASTPHAAPSIVPAGQGTLEVHVHGVDPKKGHVLVALYDRATWLDEDHVVADGKAIVDGEAVIVTLHGIAAGRYAIAILHDENGNESMDWGLTGPSEQYGFSRDAHGTLGPPSFDDAAFDFDGRNLSISVGLD